MNKLLIEQLPNIAIFLKIVEYNSLQSAATQSNLSRSVVSKKLAQLELYLGERLIQRTTRKLSLTEYGQRLYEESLPLLGFIEDLQAVQYNQERLPTGELKISCSSSFGRRCLLPILPAFNEAYPQVQVNLQLEDRLVDLIEEQIDVSIRIGHIPDSSMIAQKLGVLNFVLVASPNYLETYSEPKTPIDLKNHQCLAYRNTHSHMNNWQLTNGAGLANTHTFKSRLSVNDGDALIDLAIKGAGILMVDRPSVKVAISNGLLREVLADYQLPEGLPVYVVYQSRKGLPLKTRMFIDFLMRQLKPLIA